MEHHNEVVARYNQKKKRMKKRKQIAFYTLLVTLFIVVITVLSLTVFFNIDTITVKGNDYYSASQIIKVSGLEKGQNLFRLNKFKIIDKLEQKLPYLEKVKINRKLPVGIEITVTETEAFMYVASGKDYYLVDENLKVLEKVKKAPKGLAKISGIKPKDIRVGGQLKDKGGLDKHLSQLAPLLCEYFSDGVTKINLSKVYDIQMVYDGRVTVKFGTLENIVEKVRLVEHTLDDNRGTEKAIIEFSSDNRLHYRAVD